MPVMDMGEKPSAYNSAKSESGQVFNPPRSSYPDKVNVKYADMRPEFECKSLRKKFNKSSLHGHGINFEAVEATL